MLPNEQHLDPRVRRTRKLLLEAFAELLQEKRMQAITVQDIAERATVNRATFYAHFDDKYALFDYLIEAMFRKMLMDSLLDTCQFSPENLKRLVIVVAEFLAQFNGQCHPSDEQYRPLIETQVQTQIYGLISNWLEDAEDGRLELPTNLDTTANAMSWVIFGAGLRWSQGGQESSTEEIAEQVLTLVTRGFFQLDIHALNT